MSDSILSVKNLKVIFPNSQGAIRAVTDLPQPWR